MKNLKLYSETTLNLELLQQSHEESILFSALDIERNRLFFASSTNLIYTTHLSSFQNGRRISGQSRRLSAEASPLELEEGDFIAALDYLMEKEALLVGTQNGVLLLYSVDDNVTEVVGRVEGGVVRIAPSPDGDLLAIVSGFGQVLVMTPDWDLLYEFSLDEDPLDVSDPACMAGYSISWRGDGKYFATLSEDNNSSSLPRQKRVKVWERDSGALLATSDPKAFMGAVLEWMPSGAKIAAVYDRKAENQCPEVAFYERNGLFRNSFGINESVDATIQTLKWNCNSDLLASLVRCDKHQSIKIWVFSNNHWYLKHEIRYPLQDGVRFMWDPIKPLQLIAWTLGAQVTIYDFIWNTAVMGNSTALVIDDSKMLVTPLALSLMPPPLHLFSLKFSSAIRDVALYSNNSKNCVAAYLSDGSLSVVELPEPETWEELEGKEFVVEACKFDTVLGSFVHLAWLDSHILVGVSHYGFSHSNYISSSSPGDNGLLGFYLQEIEFVCSESHVPSLVTGSGWDAKVSHKKCLEEMVIGIVSNPVRKRSAFIQFYGGKILEYTSKLGLSAAGEGAKHNEMAFSSSCPWMGVALVSDSGALKPLLCGLDDIGRMLVGGKVLCNNCGSFTFYSNLADQVTTHLILTTKQDFLFIVDIDDILQGETEHKYENFVHTTKRRKDEENINFINVWERGAKIIGVLHGDDAAVIIQTTRGNLECIYPRKLVLASIINALVQKRFRDALILVRRHRIDFNVIVDHCGWQTFLLSASDFVKQVNNLSFITEFVCAIKNENIMDTLYKHHISLPCQKRAEHVQTTEGLDSNNKISSILLAIRKALEENVPESSARELCILTTLARSDPPALEEALERVKYIREMELLSTDDSKRASYPSAEEALKHLLWLSDSEAVFEAALGLYDLNLAAIVALNSQRDPKEFLPYLQELERMPGLIMRYNIDLRLRRVDKALKHIVSAGDAYYADCMSLLNKNPQLFPLALQLISDPAKRVQILEAWGDYLSDEKCFEEAATTYLCCSSLEKALKAYRDCGNWSGVLTVAGLLKLGKDKVMQLAQELCEELQALGRPGDAAKIALEYCQDVKNGISLLISAREWEEALRVAFMHMQEDLISEVKSASLECASTLISEYEEGLEKVGKYLTRFLAVRQRRLLLAAKLQSEERSINDLDDDTVSETSSNISGMSAYTTGTRKSFATSVGSGVSSKARDSRRQRNRGKIRAGSPGEEIALVEHLKSMSLTDGAKRELRSLLASLVMLGNEAIARKLQCVAENFQVSQMAAVKLADDAFSTDIINEHKYNLESYIQKTRTECQTLDALPWRSTVFISP
ncbi:putative elongator complex protein 1 [Turnera subulata]|uniref:Elongator complex protein 1 n=1 Tax=Turnera subulata TaxID=218843 RepID=A0A9Q0FGL9_9ROSI|nr:putative elongator complex protein 1 [Turnera subulata]